MAARTLPKRREEGGGDEDDHVTEGWWSQLRWLMGLVLLPCRPITFPAVLSPRAAEASSVTGTLLFPHDGAHLKLTTTLCLQELGPSGPTLLLLDLPVGARELSLAGRIALECDRDPARSSGGPLLSEPIWRVYCNGRRAGFGCRREAATEAEEWALRAVRAVSAGAGKLTAKVGVGGSGVVFAYFRGRFERVVGSADSETFHLVQLTGWLGYDLSLFFLRL
ncbi:protein MIZU-KUSSEI 1-like [Typha latifolia]|uniref:protein MIZU-KUSSEI 1-like n=1 Tax=Typha latifolia TaxID=4733 RepID=UPI003C2FCFFB